MNTKSISLGLALVAAFGAAHSQEFVVSAAQINAQNSTQNSQNTQNSQQNNGQACQDNCPQDGQSIDRSGLDKASVHLQILQQTSPRFSEPSNTKKPANEDKKPSAKSQEHA